MLVEKEVIRPGQYWYRDEATGEPRKLVVTPELTRYWHEQGNAMLSAGLTVPVPYEHDFDAHPMTPADKLKNNAGWIDKYILKGDALFSSVDIQDEELAKKLPKTIRWTSPWINSFTDGAGKEWKNVISHLALTTRPRIINQQPFGSIAAALSVATETNPIAAGKGYCISRAGLLGDHGLPKYPIAFSIYGGVSLSTDNAGHDRAIDGKFAKKKSVGDWVHHPKTGRRGRVNHVYEDNKNHKGRLIEVDYGSNSKGGSLISNHREHEISHSSDQKSKWADKTHESGAAMAIGTGKPPTKPIKSPPSAAPNDESDDDSDVNPEGMDAAAGDEEDDSDLEDQMDTNGSGTVEMEEILCHLLQALGVPMPDKSNANEFHRHLYEAAMSKIKELTSKGMGQPENKPDQNKPPNQQPNASQPKPQQPNPLIQQEPQPMFMSLEEINQLPDPMKGVALAMYNDNQKLRAEVEANRKVTDGLRNKQLKEAQAQRQSRITLLTKLSPRAKADLDAMLAQPNMALSMDDNGAIIDPMAQTLAVLEKGLADLPWLLTNDAALATTHAQPQDADILSEERANEIADGMARQMGCTAAR